MVSFQKVPMPRQTQLDPQRQLERRGLLVDMCIPEVRHDLREELQEYLEWVFHPASENGSCESEINLEISKLEELMFSEPPEFVN